MNNSSNNKDHNLKLLCKILFSEFGYVTYYEVKLRTKSYIEALRIHDISDVDVYACNFLPDMTFQSIGAECKSGESSALDEVYKFTGVIDYFHIDKGYFIKKKIHQNARQVAEKMKLSCYTEAELRKLLLGLNIIIEKQIKIEHARYTKLHNSIKSQKKINGNIVNYLTFDYWNKENWRNIHNIIYFLGNQKSGELFPETDISQKIVCYYILELFALSVLRNIGEAMIVNFSDIKQALKVSLYGGAEALSEKRQIYDLVNQALGENKKFSPVWEDDFVNLSSRFSDHTKDSSKIIHLLQSVREDAFYSNKVEILPKLLRNYSDLTRKFVQDLMQFISNHSQLDIKIFDEFMKI